MVTCRALDYVETLRLEKLEIKPLDTDRQREYLHRYLGEGEGEKLFWQLCGAEITALWRTWEQAGATWKQFWTADEIPKFVYNRTSTTQDGLWRSMRQDGLPPLLALGRNPYMLVMLAQVYAARKGSLPQNRGNLFAAFVDTLLAREQKRCEPALWPGAGQLRGALALLAYAMQSAGERGTAVDRGWAASQLASACDPDQAIYLGASATLLDNSGGQVRFVHQLLQEYFAAAAVQARLDSGGDLGRNWPGDWTKPSGWEETFILLAGMLPDMTLLIERLLPVNPALAARCIAESGGEPGQPLIQAVQTRLAALATSKRVPVAQRNAAGDALNHVTDLRSGVGLRADGLPDLVWCSVPAGEFLMGNTSETDADAYKSEMPQQSVWVDGFEIGKYPITNAQFDAFVQDGGYTPKWRKCWTDAGWEWKGEANGPMKQGGVVDLANHPAVNITWYEAMAFCRWLSEKLGRTVSLPTEAQWEKAARGADGRRYPWAGELTPDHANYDRTGIGTTSAVGIFPKGASPCGALDLSGNVFGWCQTNWRDNYSTLADDDPEGEDRRVVRGGSFDSDDRGVRCAYRNMYGPRYRLSYFGFRVVCVSPPIMPLDSEHSGRAPA